MKTIQIDEIRYAGSGDKVETPEGLMGVRETPYTGWSLEKDGDPHSELSGYYTRAGLQRATRQYFEAKQQ